MKPVSRTESMSFLSNIIQMVLGETVIMVARFRIKQAKHQSQRVCNHEVVFTSPLTRFQKMSENSFSLSGVDACHKRKWHPSWVSPFPLPNDDGIRPDAIYETFLQGSFLQTTRTLDMIDVEQVSNFLIRWAETWEQGIELSAEDLCQDFPDLLDEVQRGIFDLKATDWMNELDDEEDDDFLSLPTSQALSKSKVEAVALSSALTLDEFIFNVTSSGVLNEAEIGPVQQHLSSAEKPASAVDLAELLLEQNKLTQFQAELLCEGKSDGLLFGDYVILDKIAVGGMGQVFKARHRRMDRVVALKMLPDRLVDSPLATQRFEREVKAIAKLEHPNVVTAYDAGEVNGTHYLVMQYIEGQDLASLVQQSGRLSVTKSVDYIRQAAKGFEYAHIEGVIHRDIKPSNLLVDIKGTLKILDMGLARIDTEHDPHSPTQTELTQDGAVMGTVSYMPPEQALDTKSADARSDIYSLGCTLHFLLTGKPPYVGSTLMGTMLAHREDDCPMLSEIRSDVPKSLDAIFAKMIAKQPEERYQSMTLLLEDLAAVAETFAKVEQTIEDCRERTSEYSSGDTVRSPATAHSVRISRWPYFHVARWRFPNRHPGCTETGVRQNQALSCCGLKILRSGSWFSSGSIFLIWQCCLMADVSLRCADSIRFIIKALWPAVLLVASASTLIR